MWAGVSRRVVRRHSSARRDMEAAVTVIPSFIDVGKVRLIAMQ